MKKSDIVILVIAILLLAAALVAGYPLLKGPRSIPTVRAEQAALDTQAVRISALEDSVKVMSVLDSVIQVNLQQHE